MISPKMSILLFLFLDPKASVGVAAITPANPRILFAQTMQVSVPAKLPSSYMIEVFVGNIGFKSALGCAIQPGLFLDLETPETAFTALMNWKIQMILTIILFLFIYILIDNPS